MLAASSVIGGKQATAGVLKLPTLWLGPSSLCQPMTPSPQNSALLSDPNLWSQTGLNSDLDTPPPPPFASCVIWTSHLSALSSCFLVCGTRKREYLDAMIQVRPAFPVTESGCYCYGCFLQHICISQSSPRPWHCSAPWQPGLWLVQLLSILTRPITESHLLQQLCINRKGAEMSQLCCPNPDGSSQHWPSEVGGHHVVSIWAPSMVMANPAGASLPWASPWSQIQG